MPTPATAKTAVHIVTYNHAHLIDACLRPLRDLDVTVCIVDNGSTDDTVRRVEQAGYACIVNATNLGYSGAHNQALRQTQSEYVLTLNPDVVLQPGYIETMCAVLDANPDVGSAAGCLLRVNALDETPQVIDSVGLFMRRNRRQGLLLDGEPLDRRPTTQQIILGPDGAAAFYRRAMLDDIAIDGEIFDEDFFIHKEDVDLCWRALLRGWKSLYVPDAVAWHIRNFRPGKRETVDPFLRLCAVRNRYLLMLKNEDPALFRRDLLPIIAYDAAIIGYLLLRERSSLRALGSAWALRHKMSAKRRQIQSRRRATTEQIAPFMGHRS
ncbi:MAG: glycosyltransferase family 2 protein [Chloroflexota bacterium]